MRESAAGSKPTLPCLDKLPAGFLGLLLRQYGCSISEAVEPGLLGSVVLDAVQVLLAVVHVVLEGAVAVVTVIPLPHFCTLAC